MKHSSSGILRLIASILLPLLCINTMSISIVAAASGDEILAQTNTEDSVPQEIFSSGSASQGSSLQTGIIDSIIESGSILPVEDTFRDFLSGSVSTLSGSTGNISPVQLSGSSFPHENSEIIVDISIPGSIETVEGSVSKESPFFWGDESLEFHSEVTLENTNINAQVVIGSGTIISGDTVDLADIEVRTPSQEELIGSVSGVLESVSFGIEGVPLTFSKPIKIELSANLPDLTKVNLSVKHEGESEYSTRGLTTNGEASCIDGDVSEGDRASTAIAVNHTITFYSCSASTFVINPTIDQSFMHGSGGLNQLVASTRIQNDGKILVGGYFTSYNGASQNYITRLNADGSIDPTFLIGSGFDSFVYAITLQSDGKILVGGNFSSYNGVPQGHITRLNADGSIDPTFSIGTGIDIEVDAITLQSDGKILVGGYFTDYNGTPQNNIIRLNPDGSIDSSFYIGSGFDNGVNTITLQSDGKILVGGYFTDYNGTPQNRITRLNSDGSIDPTFSIGSGFNNVVRAINIQNDGKILVGGWFTSYNGTPQNRITRLNSDGSIDPTFSIGTGFGWEVYSMILQNDGKILVGGYFTDYNGAPQNGITRLNSDGSIDPTFSIKNGSSGILSIAIQSDGKIIAGGYYTEYNGVSQNYITRFNSDGTIDSSFSVGTGFNYFGVSTIVTQSDGKILVGGDFTGFDGAPQGGIIRLNADGTRDVSFSIGTGFNYWVRTIAIQGDGKILVGGFYTEYNGVPQNKITRLNADGSIDPTFSLAGGFNGGVNSITIQSDGKIIAGGDFTQYNGVPQGGIIRFNADGSIDPTFSIGSGFNFNGVRIITIQSDGKILVGGQFTTYNGTPQGYITRLNSDGSIDPTFSIGSGFNYIVNTIAIQSDGKIVIAGYFSTYNGTSRNNIIQLNVDGSVDPTFSIGSGFDNEVSTIAIQGDGKILVGGWFWNYNGVPRNSITRLNADGSLDSSFLSGVTFNDGVRTIVIESSGTILVGGQFSEYIESNSATSFISKYLVRLQTGYTVDNPTSSTWSGGPIVLSGTGIAGATIEIREGGNLIGSTLVNSGELWSYTIIGATPSSNHIYDIQQIDGTNLSGYSSRVFTWNNTLPIVTLSGSSTVTIAQGSSYIDDGAYWEDSTDGSGNTLSGVYGSTGSFQSSGSVNTAVVGTYTISYMKVNSVGNVGNIVTRTVNVINFIVNPTIDQNFMQGAGGFNGSTKALIIQSDGKILVGGNFTSYSGVSLGHIARLNSDGSIDTSFVIGTGFNGEVNTLAIQNDGKILVEGYFSYFNGIPIDGYIVRLNSDGSLDSSFNIGNGFDGQINSIVVQSDGKILMGGTFWNYNGTPQRYITRLNSDGSLDSSFVIGTGFNGQIENISIQSDGKIVVVGSFTSYNGTPRNRIARLNPDGSIDTSFVIGTGANNGVTTLAIQSDGKILIGGDFTNYNGTPQNHITRLNSDGSIDPTFSIGSGLTFSGWGTIKAIDIQGDNKILVGGIFSSYNGIPQKNITRINSDGSHDASFIVGNGTDTTVYAIAIQSDGKILMGGDFINYNNIFQSYITRLNSDGSIDSGFSTEIGFNARVNTIDIQDDGKILVGGNFTNYNGTPQNRITRLNSDGSIDLTFSIGSGFDDAIKTIVVQDDGKILVGGNFTNYNGVPQNHITRLNSDGSLDSSFVIGTGFNNYVEDIVVQGDGKIIVGGSFWNYNGTPQGYITRLNSDGSIDPTFSIGSGFNGASDKIAIQSDGKIVVGGGFTSYNGTPRNGITRLNSDGSIDPTFSIGSGFGGSPVYNIIIQGDGKIVVVGGFTNYNGTPQGCITRFNPDGSIDPTFSIGSGFNSPVTALAIQGDGKIIVGGGFTSYNGIFQNHITRLNSDGSIDPTFLSGTGFDTVVSVLVMQGEDRLLVGGRFEFYQGVESATSFTSHYLVRLKTGYTIHNPTGSVWSGGPIVLSGTGIAGATIEIREGGALIGSVVVGSGELWSYTVIGATPYSDHIYDIRQIDGGNLSGYSSRVFAWDRNPPAVTLSGSSVISISQGSLYIDDGAYWDDDGDGSGSIFSGSYGSTGSFQLSGSVNTAIIGAYTIEYLKVDNAGNVGNVVTRTVNVIDNIGPSVTINKKIGQGDPTTVSPVFFTAVFSEPVYVSTFTTGSLSTSGSTATGIVIDSIVEVAPNDGTTFEISVSASGTGTIVLSMIAGLPSTSNTIWGTGGDYLYDVTIDSLGNVYTANAYDNTVSKIAPDGTSTILGTTGDGPHSMTLDSLGNVYTANSSDNTVSKITPDGTSTILATTGDGPHSIALDSLGNIYTVNIYDNTVSKITPDGTSTILGTTGNGSYGIALDSLGNVYTANAYDNTVSKITPDGTSTILGTTGHYPRDLTIDPAGNIYTANYGNDTVSRITPDGISTIFGTTGGYPVAIDISLIGDIYTANPYEDTVSKITRPRGVLDFAENLNLASTSTDNTVTITSSTPPVVVPPVTPPSTSGSSSGGGGSSHSTSSNTTSLVSLGNSDKVSAPLGEELHIGVEANNIRLLPIKNILTKTPEFLSAGDKTLSSLSSQSNIVPTGKSISRDPIYEVTERATDYICPNIVQVYSESEIRTQDIDALNYNDNIKSMIMFRGIASNEGSGNTISNAYKQSGIVLNREAYEPYRDITRAEFVKVLAKSLACRYQYSGVSSGFPDVESSEWYAEYITYAVKNGWISGYEDGTFRPNDPITRAEAAKVLANAIQLKPSNKTIASFQDVPTTNKFFSYIEAMREKRILSGKTDTIFEPESHLSRSETAQLVYKTFLGGKR